MIAVISVLSFALAFGAIWFTSEALRRVDNYNDAKLKPHLRKIHQIVDGVEESLRTVKGRLEVLESQVRTLKLKADLPPVLEQEASALQASLHQAHHNIPTIRLNG
jgi:hypothetical protein